MKKVILLLVVLFVFSLNIEAKYEPRKPLTSAAYKHTCDNKNNHVQACWSSQPIRRTCIAPICTGDN